MLLNIEKPRRIVPGVGSQQAKIAIVGEAPGAYEDSQLKPFVGPAGSVLEQCLHAAGLIRGEVYLTNVVKVRPPKNDIAPYFSPTKGTFSADGYKWVQELREELNSHGANVIVACGATALAALTGVHKIMKFRGYVMESQGLEQARKVIPCIHPAAALRGQYILRHLIVEDLKKAKSQAGTRELVRPARQLVYDFGNAGEVLEWLDYFAAQPLVCFDIEVLNFELACISFSSDPAIAVSVPLAGRWSESDEALIWRGLQKVLGNPEIVKVGQNLIFDIQFLLSRCGIEVRGPVHDTMIAHHILYPELPKGLGFLGSLYCGAQRYWKDAVKFQNIKEES